MLSILVVAASQAWNRWYIKRLIVAEFKRQLKIELAKSSGNGARVAYPELVLKAELSTTTQGFKEAE